MLIRARPIRDICETPVEPDGLTFHAESINGRRITEDADYAGVRVTFVGTLGRAQVPMQIDVGFGDVVMPKVAVLDYPTMLDFPAPQLAGYSRESSIAEKFQAMVKLGALNSRMNDFYDVWFLSREFRLRRASSGGGYHHHLRHPAHTAGPRSKPLLGHLRFRSGESHTVEGLPCPQ